MAGERLLECSDYWRRRHTPNIVTLNLFQGPFLPAPGRLANGKRRRYASHASIEPKGMGAETSSA
jgi:hypothetical protein